MTQTLRAFDMFCGAGGSSTGMAQACAEFDIDLQLSAVNHWAVAIATHTRNHPNATHKRANVDEARLDELAPNGTDVLWASPSCTEHSYAKGGSSIDDQKRASAWAIPRAIEAWRPKVVIVENVRPFLNWGPVEPIINRKTKAQKVDSKGRLMFRPIKSRRGETFRSWFNAIESLGYSGKWNLLNAADYGEAQTRIRLFVVFTAVGYHYDYPAPSHGKIGTLEVERGLRKPWEPARKIIDFGIPSTSIFERKEPLSPNTMRRIEAGVRRYCSGPLAEAFLVVLRNHADAQSLNIPSPTVAANGQHLALAQTELTPFVCGNRTNNTPKELDAPLGSVTTTTGGGYFLAEPQAFTLGQQSNSAARDVQDPLPTVATGGKISLTEALATPFVLGQHGGGVARSVDEPLSTVSTDGYVRVFEPMVVETNHAGERVPKAVDDPAPCVTSRGAGDLVELDARLVEAGVALDRVVLVDGQPFILDIKFRMLQPAELARAQGFPDDYEFEGTKEARTAQIGNAVPVRVAYHLMRSALRAIFGEITEAAA